LTEHGFDGCLSLRIQSLAIFAGEPLSHAHRIVVLRGVGGKGVSLNCAIFPETLASAEALPGICLGVNDVSSPASLAT
jgi:hypothetical protein